MRDWIAIIVVLAATVMPANAAKMELGTPHKTMHVMVEELANGGVRIKPEAVQSKVVDAVFDTKAFDYGVAWTKAWAEPGKPVIIKEHVEAKRVDLTHVIRTPVIDVGIIREGDKVFVIQQKLESVTIFNPFPALVYTAGLLFLVAYLTVWLAKRREYVSNKEANTITAIFLMISILAWISVCAGVLIFGAFGLHQALTLVTALAILIATGATTIMMVARLAEKKKLEIGSFLCALVFFGTGTWAYFSI